MEREVIKVGMPKVICGGGTLATLQAEVDDAGERKILKYTVDRKYEKYLTWERSDAFVVALLYYAMIKDRDLEWETPCNERLIYQLETYFIPAYKKEMAFMHEIKLSGPTTTELLPSENGVATGITNGVDSCYTLRKHLETGYGRQKLSHVLFTDWYLDAFSGDYKKKYLDGYLRVLPGCAEELGLGFIYIALNIDKSFSVGQFKDEERGTIQDAGLHPLKFCSTAMALQKLLKVYYFSSGIGLSDFTFKRPDMAYHDLFTMPLISTEGLTFYSAGMERPRIEKVGLISDWPYAQKHLQVCMLGSEGNCGRCSKCVRTMSELYSFGKLGLYKDVFPVEDYMDHLSQRLAYLLAEANLGHGFEKNIIKKIHDNGMRFPVASYICAPYYMIREFARNKFRAAKWARKLYRRFSLDKRLYGRKVDIPEWLEQKEK